MNFGKQVARRLIGRPHAVALDPQPLAAGRVRRHGERDRALRRRHVDLRAQRRLGQRDRHAHVEPIARAAKVRMRADVNREQDVAGRRVARSRLALAAKANLLAVVDAGRNLHVDRFDVAVLPLHRERRLAAQHGRRERHRQLVLQIVAARGGGLRAGRRARGRIA